VAGQRKGEGNAMSQGGTSESTDAIAPARLATAAFTVVVAVQFVIVLANGSTTMVLPELKRGLQATSTQLQWYAALFPLGFAVVLVLAGRIGDLIGTRRLLLLGYSGLVATWIISAAAPNIWLLLLARLLNGVAGGVIAPQLSAIIQRTFSGHARSRAFGLFLVFAGGGFMLGQLISGFLTTIDLWDAGWRWAYLPYIPLGIITLMLAIKFIPHTKPGAKGTLDIVGASTLAVVAILVMYPLIQGRTVGWPPWIFVMLLCALPAGWLFLHYERSLHVKGGDPLVNPALFRIRTFRYGNIVTLLVGLLASAGPVYLILTIQLGFGRNPLQSALLTAPMPFANMFGSLAAAPLIRRYGRASLGIGAAFNMAAALAIILVAHLEITDRIADQAVFMIPGLVLLGFALGISIACSIAFVLSDVPHESAGSAAGVQATGLQMAGAVGLAIFGVAYYASVASNDQVEGYLQGLTWVMWLSVAFAVIQFATIRFIPKHTSVTEDAMVMVDPEMSVMPDLHPIED